MLLETTPRLRSDLRSFPLPLLALCLTSLAVVCGAWFAACSHPPEVLLEVPRAADVVVPEDVVSARSKMTVPPNGSHVSWIGNLSFENESGGCAQINGDRLIVAPCTEAADQIFAVYQMADRNYEICIPDTLNENYESTRMNFDGTISTIRHLVAKCLSRQANNASLQFSAVALTASARAELIVPYAGTVQFDGQRLTLAADQTVHVAHRGESIVLSAVPSESSQKWMRVIASAM